ncbi:MAG: hypothetical protein AABY07_01740 [Nanoarchaeota archaeon]
MKKLFLFLAVAVILPAVTAFSCNLVSLELQPLCLEIKNSNLTDYEKNLLYSSLFEGNNLIPNHDFVYGWNNGLTIIEPIRTSKQTQGAIRGAWVEIFSLMPSIIDENTLYVHQSGKVLSKSGYDVVLPSSTMSGDCLTTYQLQNNNAVLQILENNHYLGSGELTNYFISYPHNAPITFSAVLHINIQYRIRHYSLNELEECVFDYSEIVVDNLSIQDNVPARIHNPQTNYLFTVKNSYQNSLLVELNYNNYSYLNLDLNSPSYTKATYHYDLQPNSIGLLQIIATQQNYTNIHNILIENQYNPLRLVIPKDHTCELILMDHFSGISTPCDLSYTTRNLSIIINKTNYFQGESFKVYISPSDIDVNITYTNQTITARGYAIFNATKGYSLVLAQLNDVQVRRYINVIDREKYDLAKEISVASLLFYILFAIVKNYLAIRFLS